MLSKTLKTITFLMITLMLICTSTLVFADYLDINGALQSADSTTSDTPGKFQTVAGTIIAVVQVIGLTVAIVMLIALAIKYLYSSPNDRAEIKKHMIVYVIGAVLLFGVSAVLELIKSFAGGL